MHLKTELTMHRYDKVVGKLTLLLPTQLRTRIHSILHVVRILHWRMMGSTPLKRSFHLVFQYLQLKYTHEKRLTSLALCSCKIFGATASIWFAASSTIQAFFRTNSWKRQHLIRGCIRLTLSSDISILYWFASLIIYRVYSVKFRQTPAFYVDRKFSFSTAESVELHLLFPREVASRMFVGPLLDDISQLLWD